MSRLPDGRYLSDLSGMRVVPSFANVFLIVYILYLFHMKGKYKNRFVYSHLLIALSYCNLWQLLCISFLLLEFY
jgi:hypothetical protein